MVNVISALDDFSAGLNLYEDLTKQLFALVHDGVDSVAESGDFSEDVYDLLDRRDECVVTLEARGGELMSAFAKSPDSEILGRLFFGQHDTLMTVSQSLSPARVKIIEIRQPYDRIRHVDDKLLEILTTARDNAKLDLQNAQNDKKKRDFYRSCYGGISGVGRSFDANN